MSRNASSSTITPRRAAPKSDAIPYYSATIKPSSEGAGVPADSSTAVMLALVETAQQLTDADGAMLEAIEADSFTARAATGIGSACNGTSRLFSSEEIGRARRDAEPWVCNDAETYYIHRPECRPAGVRSFVAMPLQHLGRHVALLRVVSRRTGAFGDEQAAALKSMAGLFAAAWSTAAELAAAKRLLAERTSALTTVASSEDEYRAAFELASIGKMQVDLPTGRLLRVNSRFCQMLGYTADELTRMTVADITHPEDASDESVLPDLLLRGGFHDGTIEKRYVRKDGRIVWALLNAAVLRDGQGQPFRAMSTIQDITDRKRAEWLEQDRRRVLELVAKDMPLPTVLGELAEAIERQVPGCLAGVVSLQEGRVSLNGPSLPPRWSAELRPNLLRLAARASQGAWVSPDHCGVTLLREDEAWTDLRDVACEYGFEVCWAMPVFSNDLTPLGVLMVFGREARGPLAAEIQTLEMATKLATICIEHNHTTHQLAHLVRHDPLTGLSNRIMFEDRLFQSLALSRRSGLSVALMVLDVDHFKSINDTLGHHAGDQVLQQFAQRLRGRLREADTMARLGGDEFAIILPDLESAEQAAIVARKLVDELRGPFHAANRSVAVTCSIGIAMFPGDAEDAVLLQKAADSALYRVKENGRNGFTF